MIKTQVQITRYAEKQLKKIPKNIVAAYYTWVKSVETDGIRAIRKIPGYHDEPLSGDRKGQRSIRLNKAYRVIYEETSNNEIILICVLEVNKHDY